MIHAPFTVRPRVLGLLSAAFLFVPGTLLAQNQSAEPPAKLQGVVVLESTFEPIQDAVVTIMGTDIETRTGVWGDFAIPEAPEGTLWVRVTAPGLPSVREQVEITEEGLIFLQFRMPEDVTAILDEVFVDVWTPDQQATEAQTALELVAAKVPSINLYNSGDVGDHDIAVRLRGVSSFTQDMNPLLVIDGVVARGGSPLEILSRIPAADVGSIEVLRGPVAAFRYPFASNGVIHVRTNRR
jgi:hypothetical protein